MKRTIPIALALLGVTRVAAAQQPSSLPARRPAGETTTAQRAPATERLVVYKSPT